MKKSNIYIILVLIIMTIFGVGFFNYLLSDKNIIKGYYKAEEYFDPFATQDAVDYCKYYYTNKYDSIFSNKYQKISKENIEEIKDYFRNFIATKKDEWIIIENNHEPIISKDKFDKVQEIIEKNKCARSNKEKDLFYRFLKCSDCGGSFTLRKVKNYKSSFKILVK